MSEHEQFLRATANKCGCEICKKMEAAADHMARLEAGLEKQKKPEVIDFTAENHCPFCGKEVGIV